MTLRNYVIVTGASKGIGAATAVALAHAGFDIVVNYRTSLDGASTTTAKCVAAGQQAVAVEADVSTAAGVQTLFRQSEAAFENGVLVGLVNNAGVLPKISTLENATNERFEHTIQTNVVGPMMCSRDAIKRMAKPNGGQGGSIVNIGSRAAVLGSPNEFIDYAASKGALDTMTIGLAKELGPVGIRVNCVRPGLIDTDLHGSAGRPDRVKELSSAIPMKRGGTAEEVAETVAWLFSEQAAYVSGALIDVSGGR